jgi:hypothetical protein
MSFIIRGLEGPYATKSFKIAAGMTLGRRQGDILLEADNTISSLHGRIVARPNGQLCLQDAGSSNQFLVLGRKVPEVELHEGVTFQIGQCVFQVIRVSEKDLEALKVQKNWKNVVLEALERNQSLDARKATALNPVVKVDCIQGPSADIGWFLGFGPRLFGPLCEDIEILETESGDVSFEIYQGTSGPMFKSHSKNVKINQKALTEKRLEDGDDVRVGSSVFRIRLG